MTTGETDDGPRWDLVDALVADSPEPDRRLSPAEETIAAGLSADQLCEVDAVLLERASERWRKVAFLVAHAMQHFRGTLPELPAVFYGLRVRRMVEAGALESQGNLARMRFSEVRVPPPDDQDERDVERGERVPGETAA